MDYYKSYFLRYQAMPEDVKKASKEHWLRVHAENLLSGREDLIIFSAKILSMIALAEGMTA